MTSMSFFEKSVPVAGLAKTDTVTAVEKTLKTEVGAIEKTLKAEVGEKITAIAKTLKAEVGAIEKSLKADSEVNAIEKTLKTEVGEKTAALEKVVTGKLDAMNSVVWRFAGPGVLILRLTVLLPVAPNIRNVWGAPKKSE